MARTVSVVVHEAKDEKVIQRVASILRSNNNFSSQIRDFADTIENDQHPKGLNFQQKPGQLLICHFGLGFQKPEIVKTRPVLVIGKYQREWSGLCTVIPVSSEPPKYVKPHHYKLPSGTVPGDKYEQSWLKGDLIQTVAADRLDRIKTGPRKYEAPTVAADILREARRCVLHATGMHTLTQHW